MTPQLFLYGSPDRYYNYIRAVQAAGGSILVSRDLGAWHGCCGLLLPGGGDMEPWRYGQENTASHSMDPARDEAELALLEQFTAARLPILGICRGMQVLNVFFGGTLLQDLPGHSAVYGRDRLHRIREISSPLNLWNGNLLVNSAHHQAVDRLGSGLIAVQWAPDGTVEALCHQSLPIWGVQWHPERLTGAWALPGTVEGLRLFQAFWALCRKSTREK